MNYKTNEITLEIEFTRQRILHVARHCCDRSGTLLLYSGEHPDASHRSFLYIHPIESLEINPSYLSHTVNDSTAEIPFKGNPWDSLKTHIHASPGDWAGFLSYEMGFLSDEDIQFPSPECEIPLCYFQRSAIILEVDHQTNLGKITVSEGISLEDARVKFVLDLCTQPFEENQEPFSAENIGYEHSSDSFSDYLNKIEKAKEYILDGEIYQVNLSQEFQFHGKCSPFALFTNLAKKNPAPFAAFLSLGDYFIISSSPERFLAKKEGYLETRPIKGTSPRFADPIQDELSRVTLLNSEKETAELAMITDLLRNDLGKISVIGSVTVKDFLRCEAYENVYHLLSVIKSTPLPTLSSIDIIRSCFPGGSITGCPKLRAMEIIHSLEKRPRGIYTGSIGHINENGDFDFNIAIRTLVIKGEKITVSLGGGIVTDSQPIKEYEETLHKGRTIFNLLGWSCDTFT